MSLTLQEALKVKVNDTLLFSPPENARTENALPLYEKDLSMVIALNSSKFKLRTITLDDDKKTKEIFTEPICTVIEIQQGKTGPMYYVRPTERPNREPKPYHHSYFKLTQEA